MKRSLTWHQRLWPLPGVAWIRQMKRALAVIIIALVRGIGVDHYPVDGKAKVIKIQNTERPRGTWLQTPSRQREQLPLQVQGCRVLSERSERHRYDSCLASSFPPRRYPRRRLVSHPTPGQTAGFGKEAAAR